MALTSLELFHVAVPLKKAIKHASHERTVSDNLIVRATLRDGRAGYGEGVPRDYVTGETIESTFATLGALDLPRQLGRPGSYAEVVRALEALTIPETEAEPRGMAVAGAPIRSGTKRNIPVHERNIAEHRGSARDPR